MNNAYFETHIAIREKQLEDLKELQLQLELLNEESNFTEKTWREVQARISSRFAFLEISIRDHKKLIT